MANESEIMKILKGHEKRIEEHEKRIEALEGIPQSKEKTPEVTSIDAQIKKFCSEIGISKEQLKSVFDISENDVVFITEMTGKNEIERQFNTTVCILTAYHYLFGEDIIKSKDLREKLKWLGIKSLGNLSMNLAKYKKYIIPIGKPASPAFSYKITYPGIKEGLDIIRSLPSE